MDHPRQPGWPLVGGLVAAVALASFGLARWTAPSATAAASAPAPEARAGAGAGAGAGELTLPDAYLQAANIVVEKVAGGAPGTQLLAPATVTATPQGEAIVVARASGTIARLHRRLGDSVRAGEVLALVDSLDAAAYAADRSVAASRADLARRAYEREMGLFRQGVTPRQDMEAARSALAVAQAEARRAAAVARAAHVAGEGGAIAIVSPIAGRITAETATLGAFVDPRAELFRVAGRDAAQVEAAVGAQDARRVMPGQAATIVLGSGETVSGSVRSVTPTLSGASQSATVVIVPGAGQPALLIGQGVQVRISAGGAASGMVVPEEAVQVLGGGEVLFVRTKTGFHAQPVRVGTRGGGMAQILSGVAPGTAVATRNAFLLKAEANKSTRDEE